MAKAGSKRNTSLTFKHTVQVEASRPVLQPFASLKLLDVARISRGSHRFDVGMLSGGCCSKLVQAQVTNGMVTKLEVEPCKEDKRGKSLRPELAAIVTKARKLLGRETWKPIPVADFIRLREIEMKNCFHICTLDLSFCLLCCDHLPCTEEDIYTGPLRLKA